MVGCVEGILGLRPDFDGICINPAISSEWKEFTMDKDFRGKKLHITVKNPNGKQSGVSKLVLNGDTLDGNYIKADLLADTNEIVIEL